MNNAYNLPMGSDALIAQIASAYFSHNAVRPEQIAECISNIKKGMASDLEAEEDEAQLASTKKTPQEIRKSITPQAIYSFIDGRGYKSLKRHLSSNGYTEEQYKETFGLPYDYPMTAPEYAAERSALAKKMGLGRR